MEPGQLAIHHSYLLALATSGPWPGWARGARRGLRAEGIDNKKAAVPLGNFKVPGAEIYVLKRLSQQPEGPFTLQICIQYLQGSRRCIGGVSRPH